MGTYAIRIGPRLHEVVRGLAKEGGVSIQAVVERAVSEYERRCFLEGVNADFAALRKNEAVWQEELGERAEWDTTVADGLEEE
jgi:hypothetical protein